MYAAGCRDGCSGAEGNEQGDEDGQGETANRRHSGASNLGWMGVGYGEYSIGIAPAHHTKVFILSGCTSLPMLVKRE